MGLSHNYITSDLTTTPPLSLLFNTVVQNIEEVLLGRAIHVIYLYKNTVRSDPYLTEYPLKKLETTFGRPMAGKSKGFWFKKQQQKKTFIKQNKVLVQVHIFFHCFLCWWPGWKAPATILKIGTIPTKGRFVCIEFFLTIL